MDGTRQLELIQYIENVSRSFEVSEVRVFKGYRKRKDGGIKEVTIEIHDRGSELPAGRYRVIATDEDGRQASGNGDNALDVVLSTVHWYRLDE
jgi:hypothetical protein